MIEECYRVFAIMDTDDKEARVFGEGVYEGDHPYPEGRNGMTPPGVPNPRIKLDSGKYVYGCECWWGSVISAKNSIEGLTIVEVDPDEHCKEVTNV